MANIVFFAVTYQGLYSQHFITFITYECFQLARGLHCTKLAKACQGQTLAYWTHW